MGKSVGAMRCYQSDIKNMIFNKIQKNANPAIEGSWHGSGLFFLTEGDLWAICQVSLELEVYGSRMGYSQEAAKHMWDHWLQYNFWGIF